MMHNPDVTQTDYTNRRNIMTKKVKRQFVSKDFTKPGEMEMRAYSEDKGKTWYWGHNHRPCPLDACRERNIPCDPIAQEKVIARYTAEVLACLRSEPDEVSAESMFEMRAAFGPGATVINVLTGQKYRT
jgi:hypothetical protein